MLRCPAMRRVFAVMALLALAACDGRSDQAEEKSDTGLEDETAGQYDARREWMLEDTGLLGMGRDDAREAARAYVLATLPGAQVHGLATLPITGNLYLVSVDLVSGGQDQEIDLIARRYFDDAGKSYWKAQPLTADLARVITGHESRALQQKAQDAISGQE